MIGASHDILLAFARAHYAALQSSSELSSAWNQNVMAGTEDTKTAGHSHAERQPGKPTRNIMIGDFTVAASDPASGARAAELLTTHGVVHSPAFMPVGTAGSVKGLAPWELERLAPEPAAEGGAALRRPAGPFPLECLDERAGLREQVVVRERRRLGGGGRGGGRGHG